MTVYVSTSNGTEVQTYERVRIISLYPHEKGEVKSEVFIYFVDEIPAVRLNLADIENITVVK